MSVDPELEHLYALQERRRNPQEEAPMPLAKGWGVAEPYPVDALPPVLRNAALAINDKVQAPPAICAQSVLAAATLAVQGHADVLLPTGDKKPLSCFFVSVAESGERKSSVDSEAMRSVRLREKELDELYKLDMKDHKDAKDAWEAERNRIKSGKLHPASKSSCGSGITGVAAVASKKAALVALGDEPEAPLVPMLTCSEPTYEGLLRLYKEGHPSLGIYSAEGGQFLGGHGMSKDNKMKTATSLSELWDGDPIKKVRAGDGADRFVGRRLSMHLQMQPIIARVLMADDMLMGQGYLSRTLVVVPQSTSGTRFSKMPDPASAIALDVYHARMGYLLNLPVPLAKGARNELDPRGLPFSEEAQREWFRFADEVEAKVGHDGEYEQIKGLANKLPEHAARLAAVMALVEDDTCVEISSQHLASAIRLAAHYASEALRVYGASKVPAEVELAQRVLHWLQNHWKQPLVSLANIYKNTNYASSAKTARVAVDVLVAHGWLKPHDGGAIINGERRKEAWQVAGF